MSPKRGSLSWKEKDEVTRDFNEAGNSIRLAGSASQGRAARWVWCLSPDGENESLIPAHGGFSVRRAAPSCIPVTGEWSWLGGAEKLQSN